MQSKLTSRFGALKLQRTRADTEATAIPRRERELWFVTNWRQAPPWEKREPYVRRPIWFRKELVPRELAYTEFIFPEDLIP
jgi:hypothetical protein